MTIEEYDSQIDKIVLAVNPETSPGTLYHYTSWAGFNGIVSSRGFRASAHSAMNDTAELVSADHTILTLAKEHAERNKCQELFGLFGDEFSRFHVANQFQVFLACFSSARDEANQWKTYGAGGDGICLGISLLRETNPLPRLGWSLASVRYDEAAWRDGVSTGFERICDALAAALGSGIAPKECVTRALAGLYRIAAMASITVKTSVWAREQEWRQLALVRPDEVIEIFEEPNRHIFAPARSSNKPIAFSEIIVGPNQDFSTARDRILAHLASCGYPSEHAAMPEIVPSEAILS